MQDEACWLRLHARCQLAVHVVHEGLRHEDGVQASREAHDVPRLQQHLRHPRVSCLRSRSCQSEVDADGSDEVFGDGGQSLAAGEAEVIKVEVRAREDDGHVGLVGVVGPVFQVNVEELVVNGLEEHLCGEPHGQGAAADGGEDAVERRCVASELLHEGLLLQLFYVLVGEGRRCSCECSYCADALGDDDVSRTHEAVVAREQRLQVAEELYGCEYDGHAAEVGEHEARQLPRIDVAPQQFVDQMVHVAGFIFWK